MHLDQTPGQPGGRRMMAGDLGAAGSALPVGTGSTDDGSLLLSGCDVRALAARFGTPLYVYDRAQIRALMEEARTAMGEAGTVHYAAKAYLAPWLSRLLAAGGLSLDVCSGTELSLALAHGFPAARIRLHGNNKRREDLRLAMRAGTGAIVVDSVAELSLLVEEAATSGARPPILLRLNPGIAAHTHHYLQTGVEGSKFGLSIARGEAEAAVRIALEHASRLNLLGYHAHIGTQILDLEPYRHLMRTLLQFTAGIQAESGFAPQAISPGGGPGVTYTDEPALPLSTWIAALRQELRTAPRPSPRLSVEPGRAIIARAGVALYTVGAIKEAARGRAIVSVDGGMADNIRPALYQARYMALAATRLREPATQVCTVAGSYCESGDILVEDARLPTPRPGDLIALPTTGAYCLAMSSNYNGALRPAVVTVEDGRAMLVQRRQSIDDLFSLDCQGTVDS